MEDWEVNVIILYIRLPHKTYLMVKCHILVYEGMRAPWFENQHNHSTLFGFGKLNFGKSLCFQAILLSLRHLCETFTEKTWEHFQFSIRYYEESSNFVYVFCM